MKYKITVVGLGPGSKDYLTVGALEKIKAAKRLVLRTQRHPVVEYLKELGILFDSFDHMYETKKSFEEVYKGIVDELFDIVKKEDVVYAVPGSPFVAEETVQRLIHRANTENINIEFIAAASFLEAVFHSLKKDPIDGLRIMDGLQLEEQVPEVKTDMILTQVYNKMVASTVKLKLMEHYPDDHFITVIRAAGIPNEERKVDIPLYELDRIEWLDYLTSIYIPKIAHNTLKYYTMNNLVEIMEKLRSKEGCKWDAEQTHESLKPYLIEETYEVLEALEQKDMVLLEEELGDLLLQVVFHAQLAKETEAFHMGDVITGICKKLVYRHPHVFGEIKVDSASSALKSWEEMKRKEKDVKTYTDGLKRIPNHLPALMRSYKIQKKAAEVGFDWDSVEGAVDKVWEELKELLEVVDASNIDRAKEELGDLLFAVVNVARFLGIDPEQALNDTSKKFITRFEFIEQGAKERGRGLEEMSLQEMDELWDLAKTQKH